MYVSLDFLKEKFSFKKPANDQVESIDSMSPKTFHVFSSLGLEETVCEPSIRDGTQRSVGEQLAT